LGGLPGRGRFKSLCLLTIGFTSAFTMLRATKLALTIPLDMFSIKVQVK
jgi:hypothetical protein